MLAEPRELTAPAWCSIPEFHSTLGPEVGELAALAGFPPDPEQQLLLDGQFGMDRRGRLTAFEVCAVAPRQNLKTGWLKQAALGKTFLLDRPLLVWTAHEFKASREAFHELKAMIESTPTLDRQVKRIYEGAGNESIELLRGRRIIFLARSKGSGRSLSGDDVFLDEAYALQTAQTGALIPTLSARPDPQITYASSPGRLESAVLRRVRDRGRVAGSTGRLMYVEWAARIQCADEQCSHAIGTPGCACDDPEAQAQANPQAGGRISWEYLANERETLDPAEYWRERMGGWDDPAAGSGPDVFGPGRWAECGDSKLSPPAAAAVGLAVSVDRAWAAITAAGPLEDGRVFVGSVLHQRGTAGLVDEAKRIQDERGCTVVVDGKGPAGDLIPALETAGVQLLVASTDDYVQACAGLYDGVQDGTTAHAHTTELDEAVASSTWRMIGDRRVFGRRNAGDITSLEGAALARWAADHVNPFNIW